MDERGEVFREALRRHRLSAGLSQAELAARAGMSADAIGKLERGLRAAPRTGTVARLARALRLRPDDHGAFIAAAHRPAGPLSSQAREPGAIVPHELPLPPADFTGRDGELATLFALLRPGRREGSAGRGGMPICAIDGMAGIGKSALAIRAGHALVDAYPDGQLYVNLQGATPGLPPLDPLDVLGRMLRSLGLDPATTPGNVEEMAARFRSLAAGRRLLILLDNARSSEQVRCLLPGAPTCGVLITSREVLATLEGVRPLHLDVLTPPQALQLLGLIAGEARTAGEPEAAAEVVRRCGELPLAIRIAGARLAARPGWPIQELAGHLADATRRLAALHSGELAVSASFDVSIQALQESRDPVDQAAAAAFGLLSQPDGPDIGLAAAARLLDQPEPVTWTLLERLVDAQLLESPRPDRYQFHDLLRVYARAEGERRHREPERLSALMRVFGFYTATAWRTLSFLRPGIRRPGAADPRWVQGGLEFDSIAKALAWLETERANLLAAITQAAEDAAAGADIPASLPYELSTALFGFFFMRSYWQDSTRAYDAVLRLARRTGDRTAEANALKNLGSTYERLGRYAEAIDCHQESLAIYQDIGDQRGRAASLSNLSMGYERVGRAEDAVACLRLSLAIAQDLDDGQVLAAVLVNLGLAHERLGQAGEAVGPLRRSLAIYRELGDRQSEALCLGNLGNVEGTLGRHEEAIGCQHESLRIFRELGDRQGQAEVLNNLGGIHLRSGHHAQAVACQEESLEICRQTGSRRGAVLALRDLGDAYLAAGDEQPALTAWLEGLAISEALRVPEAEEIRARIEALSSDAPGWATPEAGNAARRAG